MDRNQFWETIDKARAIAGGWHGMYAPLVNELAGRGVLEILLWRNILEKYRSLAAHEKLWAAATAMLGSRLDGRFDHFLCWLVAQGKEVYLAALRDPDSLMDAEAVRRFAWEVQQNPRPPRKGYREEPLFEKLPFAADAALDERTYGKGPYPDLYSFAAIPVMEAYAIESEIVYAPDIDAPLYDNEAIPLPEKIDRLKGLLPRLYQSFQLRE